ncbi:hypothetical protein [Chitinibacter sp. S2-10]|uniref:hypothetical protein n=1 Tax=Chitinibacter sp. S2-10 TaxID=3373597 RepID=UPI0039776007
MKSVFTWLFNITALALLAACSNTPQKAAVDAKTVVNTQPALPGVLIIGRSTKVVMEEIIRFRNSKGMKLRLRNANQLEFTTPVSKANIPTEARIQYIFTQSTQGWLLTAQVFQISHPGTKSERSENITEHVRDKLNEELSRYTRN